MIARVPSRALATAPETGASTRWIPLRESARPSALVAAGSEELMSMTTEPGLSAGMASSTASRTASPSGSMVTSTSAPSAAARPEAQLPEPLRSNERTVKPSRARFAAMGCPMRPSPMKATLFTSR